MTNEITRSGWRREELCYCANVHALGSADDLTRIISQFIAGVRQKRQLPNMAAGLWLNNQLAQCLSVNRDKLEKLAELLHQNGIKLLTLNGFPFDNFHAEVVKESVYSPDWSDPKRLDYTFKLAEILAYCMPDGSKEGTISTLPLGFRHRWTPQQHDQSLQALCRISLKLSELFAKTKRSIRLCLEMEPDCVLQATDELVYFFRRQLREKAAELKIHEDVLNRHLGICFDVCHQAVMFEDVTDSLRKILDAGIVIGKVQVSSALEARHPDREDCRLELQGFAEPKYLHQVRTRNDDRIISSLDLGTALQTTDFPTSEPWRIHFHVPIQTETLSSSELSTTQAAISELLDFLAARQDCRPHLEVETYTWHVLPEALRPRDDASLINGLTQELSWLEQAMRLRQLLEENADT